MTVLGFSPHAHSAGVFAKKRIFTLNPTSWSYKGGATSSQGHRGWKALFAAEKLGQLWGAEDAYLDLAASAVDAVAHFQAKRITEWKRFFGRSSIVQSVRFH